MIMEFINLTGLAWGKQVLLTKYHFEITQEVMSKTVKRLTNQLWKLIPMREHEEDWLKQLEIVILEVAGLNEIFIDTPQFL